jgi:Trypsin-like peptidase domain
MKKQLALLVAISTLVLDLRAQSIPEIVSHAKQSILEIVNIDAKGAPTSYGSGFFISADGLAITNRHVIAGASRIVARSLAGTLYLMERVYFVCPQDDLAVLKFSAASVPFLKLGYSPSAVKGQHVLVNRQPWWLVRNRRRRFDICFPGQPVAYANKRSYFPGFQRFPVLDEKGRVIAVVRSTIPDGQNLNFSIPLEKLTEAWSAAGQIPAVTR